MRICGYGSNYYHNINWGIEFGICFYFIYLLIKLLKNKYESLIRSEFDKGILYLSLSNIFFVLIGLFVNSKIVEFINLMIKFEISIVLAGSLLFEFLIYNAKFAVRYLKYYVLVITFANLFFIVQFFYQYTEQKSNKLDCGISTFFNIIYIVFIIYFTIFMFILCPDPKKYFKSNQKCYNYIVTDEYTALNNHLKRQFKVIHKLQKYYFLVVILSIISFALDFYVLDNPIEVETFNNKNIIKEIKCSVLNNDDISSCLICFILFIIKDIAITFSLILITISKPTNSESNQAFLD